MDTETFEELETQRDWNKNAMLWREIINNMRYNERALAVLLHKTASGEISNDDYNTLLTAVNNDCLSSKQAIDRYSDFFEGII